MTIAKDGPRLPSVQVADALRQELKGGAYAPEEKLPSIRALSERFGIAEETVKKALAALRAEGLIFSVPNRGHFVAGPDGESNALANGRGDLRESIDALRSQVEKLSARVAKLEGKPDASDA
jgi:DNA-binding GntR family transcriptional regulator